VVVEGTTSLDRGETRWRFEPARDWLPATYTLTIEPILEDPAGNSITRVFDRDLTQPDDDSLDAAPVTIPFDCTEPSSQRSWPERRPQPLDPPEPPAPGMGT
jgi:hypothetical protein